MAKNQESASEDSSLALPVEPMSAPVQERKLYIVHSKNEENVKGLGFRALTRRGGNGRGRAMLDRGQQAQLGKLLRDLFADVAQEPVPDRFVKLIEALEAREKAGE